MNSIGIKTIVLLMSIAFVNIISLIIASHCWALWSITYGGDDSELVSSIRQTADGGYIVAGQTASFGAGDSDLWVLKLAADGTPDWEKSYGGNYTDYANSIQQTTDGGYIVAGQTLSFGAGDYYLWVLKINNNVGCGATSIRNALVINTTSAIISNTSVTPRSILAGFANTSVVPENTTAETSIICYFEELNGELYGDQDSDVLKGGPGVDEL